MTGYGLGIDFGTSGVRAIVVDQAGQVQHNSACPSTTVSADVWRTILFELIAEIPESLRSRLHRIAIDGTSATVLGCNSAGKPLLPALLYNDGRATAELGKLQAIVPANHVVLSPSSSLAKLLWLNREFAAVNSHQGRRKAIAYLMHQADWLAFLLHGQPGISDYHNSLKLGYDPVALAYPDWFRHPDLAAIQPLLPKVTTPGAVIGPVQPGLAEQLGLPIACQVCAGTTDSIAAFLASRAMNPGQGVTSLGSTLVLKLLSRRRVENAQCGIYSHRLGNLWLVGGASNTGGAILRHYFSDRDLVNLSQQIDRNQASSLDYYPLLQPGERFPINDPNLPPRLDPRPSRPVDFLHGLLESLAKIEAQGYRLLQEQGASPLTQVLTAGGGAKNQTWQAIRQRYLQIPVMAAAQTEAAYGTALLALRGLEEGRRNGL
ncbi:MAG: FGGY-family carbohydrate kinase [Aphanocapsa sp. GSE-SYN-MK-11-07L]|nr:FGGY-family carbohydrate kinase [Aphanocapsa sp. GSE-SYN-MK-11-07L]